MSRLIRIRPVKLHISQAVTDYLEFKRAQGLAESTLKDYTQRLDQFTRRYAPAVLEEESLRRAIVAFLSDKVAPATYNLRLVTLHGFCRWCVGQGFLTRDLTAGFKKRVAQGRVVQIDNDVLAELLKQPDQTTFSGLRDYALLLLSLDTGIRPGEALKLQPMDFDARALTVTIPAAYAKTRRQGWCPSRRLPRVCCGGWWPSVTPSGLPMRLCSVTRMEGLCACAHGKTGLETTRGNWASRLRHMRSGIALR